VDGLDIQPFVDLLTGAGVQASALATVPEPASLVLMVIGAALVPIRRRRWA
jgi:hypothetical protein